MTLAVVLLSNFFSRKLNSIFYHYLTGCFFLRVGVLVCVCVKVVFGTHLLSDRLCLFEIVFGIWLKTIAFRGEEKANALFRLTHNCVAVLI